MIKTFKSLLIGAHICVSLLVVKIWEHENFLEVDMLVLLVVPHVVSHANDVLDGAVPRRELWKAFK